MSHSRDTVKDIRITVTDDEHEDLKDAKDDRTWREAILEEFGVKEEA